MPPKIQTSITSFFGQQPQRPLPFTSPDPHRDGFAVVPRTPSQRRSQSPGVIVPGTPPTPFSLEAQSVPRSASPVLGLTYDDHKTAFERQEGLSTQFPPRSPGPTLSPSSGTTAEYFAAQQAYQQFADAQQKEQQQQQQEQEDPDKAAARQRAAIQAQLQRPGVLTQFDFKGGKTRSKMVKKSKRSKKSNKRRNRRSRSRSRSKKSYFY